jgi:hypothetical protein
MNYLVTILISLGLSFGTLGQSPCDHQKKADSAALVIFSQELKIAVMTRDMNKIATHFQFPFLLSFCKLDENNNKQDTFISRKSFLTTKYKDFFGVWFMETVSKGYIYYSLDSDEKDGRCRFVFDYPSTFISKKSICSKVYFSIEKIQGQYKFTSSWTSQ